MMNADRGPIRKWALWSLLAVAIFAAPAAYSEVMPLKTGDPDSGTILGSYLSGRVARGDQDTTAAAEFYAKAVGW